MPRKKRLTFEESLERLEELVDILENGDISLEESLNYYKEGIELASLCSKELEEAEKQVMMLQKNAEGKFIEKPYQIEENNNEF
ncbi:MAG: exodeoxyribonuclease small subunit [Epulopiscium sp.]|jgi:exodeoxyribonuclease VII small subunit|nr:exodeoxyribonuclease VII small subunit [Defluviitalea raffinosedens]MBM7685526.1 exodeoxyribonuclease VII small subunit [Defluviitalea raffinosedens]MBZ4668542.1 xseB [Defluviitaleaceae bacterium]MDK2788692.1 exodeoxyribonuclease small subunit [Candidatus Epulonipiscium sp.]HHW66745.1 exodeoxyribonuclease VII small subunit [Candidatus Epulonipiscium sp.]